MTSSVIRVAVPLIIIAAFTKNLYDVSWRYKVLRTSARAWALVVPSATELSILP